MALLWSLQSSSLSRAKVLKQRLSFNGISMATAFQSYLSNQVTVAGRSGCPERARVILCPGCDPQLGHPTDLQDLHSALQLVLDDVLPLCNCSNWGLWDCCCLVYCWCYFLKTAVNGKMFFFVGSQEASVLQKQEISSLLVSWGQESFHAATLMQKCFWFFVFLRDILTVSRLDSPQSPWNWGEFNFPSG